MNRKGNWLSYKQFSDVKQGKYLHAILVDIGGHTRVILFLQVALHADMQLRLEVSS
jgi:hypothetical protein